MRAYLIDDMLRGRQRARRASVACRIVGGSENLPNLPSATTVSLVVSERRTTGSPATRGPSLWQENAIVWHKKPRAFKELTLTSVSNQITPMSFIKTYATIVLSLGLFAAADSAKCALVVNNGDFQDLTGLTPQPGVPGWYQGVPAGWTGYTGSPNYNVINYSSGNIGANLQTLSFTAAPFTPLYQEVGSLNTTATITLDFVVLGLNANPVVVGAAIYNTSVGSSPSAGWAILASASYTTGGFQTLQAIDVPANTPLAVGFWGAGGSPGLDSVTVVPEPSTYALLVLSAAGLAAHVARRRRLR